MTDGYDCYQNALAERVNLAFQARPFASIQGRGEIELPTRRYSPTKSHLTPEHQMAS